MVTIGITGLQAAENPSSGIAVARCLRADPEYRSAQIVGLDYDPYATGLYRDDLFDRTMLLPSPVDSRRLLAAMRDLKQGSGLDVLLPCLDGDVPVFASMSEELQGIGIRHFLPTPEQIARRGKTALKTLCEGGISSPKTLVADSWEEFVAFVHGTASPIVIKGHSTGIRLALTWQAALVHGRVLQRTYGWPLLVQEFIDGEDYCITGVGFGDGSCGSLVTIKKLGMNDQGKAWSGVVVENDGLTQAAHHIISSLTWRGPFEMDIILSQNGRKYLIDFNPRFPSWVFVAAAAGRNVVSAAVGYLFQHSSCDGGDIIAGTAFARCAQDVVVDISRFGSNLLCKEGDLDGLYRII